MNNYIQLHIENLSKEQLEILIAILAEIHFYAFSQEDSFEEENKNSLSAFIKEENFNEAECQQILLSKNISYSKTVIENTNWNAKWEGEFEPIIVEDFVAIRAAFHKPIPNVEHEIIITPKMSFGTGHHATTYLMLLQMQQINFQNKTVLDFGTGTGILSILAKKSGAAKVVAIDNDEWSITNAAENIIANDCDDIELIKRNYITALGKFDIIVANINLNVITDSTHQFQSATHQSSLLLLSGCLCEDEKLLVDNFTLNGFTHIITQEKAGWISMLLKKS